MRENRRKQLRCRLIEEGQAHCHYCGRAGTLDADPDGRVWTVDRVIPGSRGGTYSRDNVVLACWHCNCSKGPRRSPRMPPSMRSICDDCGQYTDWLPQRCPTCGQALPKEPW